MGERTEMYYIPQRSPLPAELGVESWAADRAVEEMGTHGDGRPILVSFLLSARILRSLPDSV